MWISRKKFDALEKRIAELETFRRDSVYHRYFEVYSPEDMKRATEAANLGRATGYWSEAPFHATTQSISVKEVVEKILAHIGINLVYVSGKPAKIELKKSEARD